MNQALIGLRGVVPVHVILTAVESAVTGTLRVFNGRDHYPSLSVGANVPEAARSSTGFFSKGSHS